MADDRNDAADPRQNEPRQGLQGKGFDAGTGYGGAGNDALYSGESAYGGQSAQANSSLGGAYRGEGYGRPGDDDVQGDQGVGEDAGQNVARDTDGRGSANWMDRAPDPDVEAVTDAAEGQGGRDRGHEAGGPDAIDLADMNGATRREPGR